MTKNNTIEKPEQVTETLEMAPEQKPFLEGDYFTGLCEIAAASHLKQPLFTSTNNIGIFNSLYFKRIFARKQNPDNSWTVGDFAMQNRYLYNYDRITRTYGSKKEENYNAFISRVKEIIATKNFKLFSTVKVDKVDELDEVLS